MHRDEIDHMTCLRNPTKRASLIWQSFSTPTSGQLGKWNTEERVSVTPTDGVTFKFCLGNSEKTSWVINPNNQIGRAHV